MTVWVVGGGEHELFVETVSIALFCWSAANPPIVAMYTPLVSFSLWMSEFSSLICVLMIDDAAL